MRKNICWMIGLTLLPFIFIWGVMICPLGPLRPIYEEISPDNTMKAVYSWKGAGIAGLFIDHNPWVCLDIYEVKSGKRIKHSQSWGDVPWDGIEMFHKELPWPAKRTKGDYSDYKRNQD